MCLLLRLEPKCRLPGNCSLEKPGVAVKITLVPAQKVVAEDVSVPAGSAFIFMIIAAYIESQPVAFVTSTVTEAPFVNVLLLKIPEGPV